MNRISRLIVAFGAVAALVGPAVAGAVSPRPADLPARIAEQPARALKGLTIAVTRAPTSTIGTLVERFSKSN